MVSPISGLLGSQGKYHYKGSSSDVEKWFTKQNTFLSAFCISTCICMYVIYLWMEKWRKILQRKQLCGQPVSGLFPLHHRAFSRVLLGWEVVCPLLLEAVVPGCWGAWAIGQDPGIPFPLCRVYRYPVPSQATLLEPESSESQGAASWNCADWAGFEKT